MDKANPRLHIAHVFTLARWLARKAVKAEWQAQGLRLQSFEPRELNKAATTYLDQHRDDLVAHVCAYLERFAQKRRR
jgi:hypothetical protein